MSNESVTGVKQYRTGGGAGAATLSREERFLSPKALAIAAEEERQSDRRHAEYDALRKRLDHIRVDLADAEISLSAARRAPKPNAAVEARYEAKIEAFKAQLRDEQKRYDDRQAKTAGSAVTYTRAFLREVNRQTRDCNTAVELAPGKDERGTMALLRDQHGGKRAEKVAVAKLPRTADEIAADISNGVDRVGTAAVSLALRGLRSVHLHGDTGKLEPRSFELPQITIANGVGGLSTIPDGVALLCALDPEGVKQKLTALALEGHDDRKALSMEDRRAKIDAINAEILLIERKSEAIIRHCFENGIEPGARLTSNPLAILDISFV